MATQRGARPTPRRVRHHHPSPAPGRRGQPGRPGPRQQGTAVDSARNRSRPRRPGRHARDRGPPRLQIHLSWAPAEEEALAIAHDQWRSNVFAPPACWDVESIEAFDVISENVTPDQVKQSVRVSSDFGQHTEWLREYIDQGWDELYLHFVGKEQSGFIDAFGEHVLPQLSPTAPQTRAAIA